VRKDKAIIDIYAALDLDQRTVLAVLESSREADKIINELKIRKQAESALLTFGSI
jgi:hypothetical protein